MGDPFSKTSAYYSKRIELILNFLSSKQGIAADLLLALHQPENLSKASSSLDWIDLPGKSFMRHMAIKAPAARSDPTPRLKQCKTSGLAMVGDAAPGIERIGDLGRLCQNGSGGSPDQVRAWQWSGRMSYQAWAGQVQGNCLENIPTGYIVCIYLYIYTGDLL